MNKLFNIFFVISLFGRVLSLDWSHPEYSFNNYFQDFNLRLVEGSSEYNNAKSIFDSELIRVKSHNSQNLPWKESINRFSHFTPLQKKGFTGRSKSVSQSHKSLRNTLPNFQSRPLNELPPSIDWRSEGISSAVKDQGYCGSCWAFASTAVLESHLAKSTGLLFDLSVQQVAMCSPNPNECGGSGGCMGATAEIAFDYLSTQGVYEEYQYGYLSYYGQNNTCSLPTNISPVAKMDGFVKLSENNYTDLMNAVAQIGPIAISVDASSWGGYSSGVFDGCFQEHPDVDHAVVLMGYGTDPSLGDYWLIRNSWSPTWGEKGYIRLRRQVPTENDAGEEGRCGMDVTPSHGTACKGETQEVKVCGTCGILYDSSYPVGVRLNK